MMNEPQSGTITRGLIHLLNLVASCPHCAGSARHTNPELDSLNVRVGVIAGDRRFDPRFVGVVHV